MVVEHERCVPGCEVVQRIGSSSALGFRQRRSMALEAELLLGVPGSFISDRHIVPYAVQNPLWNVKSLQDLLFDALTPLQGYYLLWHWSCAFRWWYLR